MSNHTFKSCYVTDRNALSGVHTSSELLGTIKRAIDGGVDWIQVREKDLLARDLFQLVRGALQAAANSRTQILVNDRLDIALASGAAGVHLGEQSIDVATATRWIRSGNAPPGFLVGASCHRAEQVLAAQEAGADYAFFGPVFATPSKAAYGPPQGIASLCEACGRTHIPVLAIGGVSAENISACLGAGAAGIAAIRLFQENPESGTLKHVLAGLRQCR